MNQPLCLCCNGLQDLICESTALYHHCTPASIADNIVLSICDSQNHLLLQFLQCFVLGFMCPGILALNDVIFVLQWCMTLQVCCTSLKLPPLHVFPMPKIAAWKLCYPPTFDCSWFLIVTVHQFPIDTVPNIWGQLPFLHPELLQSWTTHLGLDWAGKLFNHSCCTYITHPIHMGDSRGMGLVWPCPMHLWPQHQPQYLAKHHRSSHDKLVILWMETPPTSWK